MLRATAAALHARELPNPVEPAVWWLDVDAPALVLGSSEPLAHVDHDACRRAGVDVVRRRSGGGSVLVAPGDTHWVDIVLPRNDPLWVDDVGQSAWWLGESWQRALLALGVGGTSVHHGPMLR